MIRETYNYAIKLVQGNEVEILQDVIYESVHDVPSQLTGFETYDDLMAYMIANDLVEYVSKEEML